MTKVFLKHLKPVQALSADFLGEFLSTFRVFYVCGYCLHDYKTSFTCESSCKAGNKTATKGRRAARATSVVKTESEAPGSITFEGGIHALHKVVVFHLIIYGKHLQVVE